MSFAPYAVIWVALVVAAVICLLVSRRPRLHDAVALAFPAAAIALWFFFRPDATVATLSFAGRVWSVGATAWQLTGVVLLLLLTAVIYMVLDQELPRPRAQGASACALAAAALPPIWAADDRTRVLGIALFVIIWALCLWSTELPEGKPSAERLRPAFWLSAALFPLWLAGALPSARFAFMLLASVLLLGVWPLSGWRAGTRGNPATALLLGGLPVIVGAAILSAAISVTPPTATEIAVVTALGLLSLIVGLARAWDQSLKGLAEALGLGLAGLALVAGIWGGEAALVAAARLAVFVPAVLLVSDGQRPTPATEIAPIGRIRIAPVLVAPAVVYLAVAGLPLTVGFAVLSRLYEAWGISGGLVLTLVTMLLMSLWLAAVFLTGWAVVSGAATARVAWLRSAVFLLPVIGLISLDFTAFNVGALTWIAIAIPPVAGILLGRFVPGLGSLDGLLRESAGIPLLTERFMPHLRQFGRLTSGATADALAILEGEYGLLWLLGLLLLLLWLA